MMCKKKKAKNTLVRDSCNTGTRLEKKKERQCEKHHTMTGLNETMKNEELVQALPLGNLY